MGELHSMNTINQVTIARGYVQLAQSGINYDRKLRRSIECLLELATSTDNATQEMSAAARKKISEAMKMSYAERKAAAASKNKSR